MNKQCIYSTQVNKTWVQGPDEAGDKSKRTVTALMNENHLLSTATAVSDSFPGHGHGLFSSKTLDRQDLFLNHSEWDVTLKCISVQEAAVGSTKAYLMWFNSLMKHHHK